MIEIPFILGSGLLGSAHCMGMCGGLAVTLGAHAPGLRNNLRRQMIYSVGRLFTYAALGAMAGFVGLRVSSPQSLQWLELRLHVPAWLSILAGLLLTYQGLLATGFLPWSIVGVGKSPCLAAGFLASFLTSPRAIHAFLAGVFTGFLPCGLLYGMLALATSTRHMAYAAGVMILFGLGTMPMMMLAGMGGSVLRSIDRSYLMRTAAWCLVLTGIITLTRGVTMLPISLWQHDPSCPFCR